MHPLLVQFLKKKNVSRHNTPERQHIALKRWNTPIPPLIGCSSLRGNAWTSLTGARALLHTSEQMNSRRSWQYYVPIRKWTPYSKKNIYISGLPPCHGLLMQQWKPKPLTTMVVPPKLRLTLTPTWTHNPHPRPQTWPESLQPVPLCVVPPDYGVTSCDRHSNACLLLRWTMPPTQLEKEKTFVIKLSLRLRSHPFPSWPKNKTLACVE